MDGATRAPESGSPATAPSPGHRPRVAVLISGRGSNMVALLDAAADPAYPAEIALVLSNRADAAGLVRAGAAGIATAVVESRRFKGDRAGFEAAVQAELDRHGVELVALAGFMRVLTEGFVTRWSGRMLNIHPSILPSFPGLDTHARALAAGVKLHGCTVHLVSPGVDEGPIVAQAAVPVLQDDDESRLAARVLAEEHRLYPAALAWLAQGVIPPGPTQETAGGSAGAVTNTALPDHTRAVAAPLAAEGSLVNPLPRFAPLPTRSS